MKMIDYVVSQAKSRPTKIGKFDVKKYSDGVVEVRTNGRLVHLDVNFSELNDKITCGPRTV